MYRAIVFLLLFLSLPFQVFGWGQRAHSMATRVAVSSLPQELPAFFREAVERLAYQASEPDRWRGPSTPALTGATSINHHFGTELWGKDPIPATRSDLLLAAMKRGLIREGKPVSEFGTGPIGAVEMAERLVCDFRYWREGTAETETERQVLRQLEDNVLYTAGVLAHYVTDLANPMHSSVHINGWVPGFPNLNGFVVRPGKGLHSRFESNYVQQYMTEKEVAELVTPVRKLGPWIKELEMHTRRANSHVEKVYEFDQKGAFGSGNEPAEARPFTAARLAEGASMLRDIWYTAWLLSRDQWLNEPLAYIGRNGRTVLEQMQELHSIDPRHHLETERKDGVLRIVRIDNRKNGLDGREWRLYLNASLVTTSIDNQPTKLGDRIDYKFERTAAASER